MWLHILIERSKSTEQTCQISEQMGEVWQEQLVGGDIQMTLLPQHLSFV